VSKTPKPVACRVQFFDYATLVSAVELAIKEVKKLSPSQAQELLTWLGARPLNGATARPAKGGARRKQASRPSMKKIKSWYDSIRFTTNWEPPRMPGDLVKRTSLCEVRAGHERGQ
jgi:hypothetical protein